MMKRYSKSRTVSGGRNVYTKQFTFSGAGDTSLRDHVDVAIKVTIKFDDFVMDARNVDISLNAAQALAVVEELTKFFGFLPHKTLASPHGPQEYKGNGKHALERVSGNLFRLRVPGGWLYGSAYLDHRQEFAGDTTFVPVPAIVGYKI